MNKLSFWRGLLIAACALGFPSGGVLAQYEADEGSPLITTVSPTGYTQLTSNCTWKPEKGSDNYLPENNEAFYDEGNYLGTLIDGSQTTYWHSDPTGMDYRTQLEYIQADLGRDDLQRVYLYFNRRYDYYGTQLRTGVMPTAIDIYASNTPDDESSWTKVQTIEGIPETADNTAWPYMSPVIDFGGAAYQYVRVVPTAGTYSYWCPAEMQFYPAREVEDYSTVLQSVVDSIYDAQIEFYAGTTPGYVSYDDSVAYAEGFAAVLDVLDKSDDQAELREAVATLRNLVASTYAKIIPVTDGAYFIESAYPAFAQKQPGVTYAMLQQDGDETLRWAKLNTASPGYYFYLKRLGNGNYLMQNLLDYRFVGWASGDARSDAVPVRFTTDSTEQILTPTGKGSYYISAKDNAYRYLHAIGHGDGLGTSGTCQPASNKEERELWKFVAADTTNLQEYRNASNKAFQAQQLSDSIAGALQKLLQVKAPGGLIKEASQMTSNCEWTSQSTYYGVGNLLDGDHVTHFHSSANAGKDLRVDDEWLQIDLGRSDVQKFVMEFWGRDDASHHDTPNDIVIAATNTPGDDTSWTDITRLNSGFPGNVQNAHYISPAIDMGAAYRYVRMHVKGVTSGLAYWNLSEYQLYAVPLVASANSAYSRSADMKAAADELDAALITAEEHISALTVDGSEMTAVNAALAKITKIESNAESVQAVIDNATTLYGSLFVMGQGLIKDVNTHDDGTNQLWSNCTWTGIDASNDNYSFNAAFIQDGYNLLGTLIDNDDQTYWHSDPTGFNVNTQNGFFQIDLKRSDVSSYVFMLCRRNDFYIPENGNRHGQVPKSLDVYATNDASVGTSLDSDNSAWASLGTITGIPNEDADGVWPYYTAAVGDGTAYQYLRVRFYNSSQAYIGLSGFNVYDGKADNYDHDESPYYALDGMKDAADKMKSLADALQAKNDAYSATNADVLELQAAIDAVKALRQDKEELVALAKKAQSMLENVTDGTNMGQLSDASTFDALETAAEAALGDVNSSNFAAVRQNLDDAYEAFISAIVQPVPGKWYYILSATSPDDFSPADGYYEIARDEVRGTALYVLGTGKGINEGDYAQGNQLRWGMDDIKEKDREGDVDAVWRLVPAENLGKRVYYVQNLRTGLYIGDCNVDNLNDFYYMQSDTTEVPFSLEFVGNECFNLVPLAGGRAGIPINFGDNARQIRGDEIESVPLNRASLTFEEFEDSEISIDFDSDSSRIVTLPFAVADIHDGNTGIKAYTLHSAVEANGEITGIGLKEKSSFAAGEPFILVVGDTANYNDGSGKKALAFPTPEPTSMLTLLAGDTVNGLIGSIPETRVKATEVHDYLFFRSRLYVDSIGAAAKRGVTVMAHTGYIDPALITDGEGTPDEVLYIVNGAAQKMVSVAKIAAKGDSDRVSVYSIDGVLVRKDAKPAEALNGLSRGIYIINGKKVVVP